MAVEGIERNDLRFLCRLQYDYRNLHVWIRRRLPMPKLCSFCGLRPPVDLANITGKYTKDFVNWKYLCRDCHGTFDHKKDMTNRMCSICGSSKTLLRPRTGWPFWYIDKDTGGWLCNICRCRKYYYQRREQNILEKREYYLRNKSHALAWAAENRYKNKERIREANRVYRLKNRDRLNQYSREYRERNKERLRDFRMAKYRLKIRSRSG